jgi:hypothetical protein
MDIGLEKIPQLGRVLQGERPDRREILFPPYDLAPERRRDANDAQCGTERRHEVAEHGRLPLDLLKLGPQELRGILQPIAYGVRPFRRKEGAPDGLTAQQGPAYVADDEPGAFLVLQMPETL